ncbi:sterile alpha motif domain-containing protein 1-like [Lathamus discolor]|uniref:sterile alpha motif domain-containing protein 1-like n=1 Tax=Lathamus discolor TaxID=678569 RepID=UPI0032B790C2
MTESGAQRLQRGAPAGGEGRRRALWRQQQQQQETPSPSPPLPPPTAARAAPAGRAQSPPPCRAPPGLPPLRGAAPLKLPGVGAGAAPPTLRRSSAAEAALLLPAPFCCPGYGITGRAGLPAGLARDRGSVRGRGGAVLRSLPPPMSSRRPAGLAAAVEAARRQRARGRPAAMPVGAEWLLPGGGGPGVCVPRFSPRCPGEE